MEYKPKQINVSMILPFIRKEFSDQSISFEDLKIRQEYYNFYVNLDKQRLLTLNVKSKEFDVMKDDDDFENIMNVEQKPLPDDVCAYIVE